VSRSSGTHPPCSAYAWGFLKGNMWQAELFLVRSDGQQAPGARLAPCLRRRQAMSGSGLTFRAAHRRQQRSRFASGRISTPCRVVAARDVIAYIRQRRVGEFSRVVFDNETGDAVRSHTRTVAHAHHVTLAPGLA